MVLVTLSFDEFLYNRSIRVVIDGISSNLYPVNSGVPQGSVISPTLFLLFLNDPLCLTFNAHRTHCCLLSHKRISDPGQNVCMGGMEIVKSETLDVLGTSIRSDVSFQCVSQVFRLFEAV